MKRILVVGILILLIVASLGCVDININYVEKPEEKEVVEKEIIETPPKTEEKPKEIIEVVKLLCLNQAVEKLDALYDGQAEGYITVRSNIIYYYIHYAHDKRRIVTPYTRDRSLYYDEKSPSLEIKGHLEVPKVTEEMSLIFKSLKSIADEGEYKYIESDPIIKYSFTFFKARLCKNIFEGKEDKNYDPYHPNVKIGEKREKERIIATHPREHSAYDFQRERLMEKLTPANINNYISWLEGYIKKNGLKNLMWTPLHFPRVGIDYYYKGYPHEDYDPHYLLQEDCKIPYLYTFTFSIIVPPNVHVKIPYEGTGSVSIYYMEDYSYYTPYKGIVWMYSDKEFEEIFGDTYYLLKSEREDC